MFSIASCRWGLCRRNFSIRMYPTPAGHAKISQDSTFPPRHRRLRRDGLFWVKRDRKAVARTIPNPINISVWHRTRTKEYESQMASRSSILLCLLSFTVVVIKKRSEHHHGINTILKHSERVLARGTTLGSDIESFVTRSLTVSEAYLVSKAHKSVPH